MRSVVVEYRLGNTVWAGVIHSTSTTGNSIRRFLHLFYLHKVQLRDFQSNAVKLSVDKCPCLRVPEYPGPTHEDPATPHEEVVDGQLQHLLLDHGLLVGPEENQAQEQSTSQGHSQARAGDSIGRAGGVVHLVGHQQRVRPGKGGLYNYKILIELSQVF